jgi:hypothetical protein
MFPAHLRSFFTLGSVREDCWICRSRIAVLRATFPDKTYSLACLRCMDTVRRNYSLLDSDPLVLPFAPPPPPHPPVNGTVAPATPTAAPAAAPAPSVKKSTIKKSAGSNNAATKSTTATPAPTPQPKAIAPAHTAAVPPPSTKAKNKVSFKTPAANKSSYPVTPSPPAKGTRTAMSTGGVTKKRLIMSDVTQLKSPATTATTATATATATAKQVREQPTAKTPIAKTPAATPAKPPKPQQQQQQSDGETGAPDVSREALQYCDAGQRVFESDARTAVHHFQRAANAQASELFSRDAAPSERARRVLAVCHANVSAARLALNEPQAALDAAAHAIAADSSWSRPFYRQAKSLLALGRAADACSALALARRRFSDDESLRSLHRQARHDRLQQNGVFEPNTDDEEDDDDDEEEAVVVESKEKVVEEDAAADDDEAEEDEGEDDSGAAYGDENLDEDDTSDIGDDDGVEYDNDDDIDDK